ncbi:15875_t:CDS:1 [Cetraspora pellucida]|uniref:15875_t:CDS:1 n=1 Tax=Cetraspora pellucida TaxID=1433469 RepID=A0A9N9KKN0_9GLOM|nr:15875_t:CDS:1 [Cetraspora pellucida]
MENYDSASNASTSNNNEIVVIGNIYSTKDNWIVVEDDDNNEFWRCMHCQKKTYAIKTSRTHLKKHTLSCFNSPLNEIQTEGFKPITKEDVDNSIMDIVIASGVSFNILNNLSFRKMARNLCYVTPSYKIPHSTMIS